MLEKTFFYILSATLLISCNKIKEKSESLIVKIADDLNEPIVEEKIITELYPELGEEQYEFQNINGIQLQYLAGFYEYYFKYSCDIKLVSDFICHMMVESFNEVEPDSSCTLTTTPTLIETNLTSQTLEELSFFFEYEDLEQYEILETTKTPFRHTLIIDKKSQIIYHRIEEFKE